MTKPLPRFELAGRIAESDLRSLTRPVPPLIAEAAGEASVKHEQLAHRFGETSAVVIATRAKLADAETADAEAARRAVERGQPISKAKADAIRVNLTEAERELQAVAELIPESARRVLTSAAPHAGRVADEAEQRASELEQQGLDALRAIGETFAAAGALRSEAGWAQELHDKGIVRPWSAATKQGEAQHAIVEAVARIERERARRVERLREMESEAEALDAVVVAGVRQQPLPPPPGREVWDAEKAEAREVAEQDTAV